MFRTSAAIGGLMLLMPLTSAAQSTDDTVRRTVTMKVGESVVLRGAAAPCAEGAVESARAYGTGHLLVSSARCGGRMTMPQMVFVAERPGSETLSLRHDTVAVTVLE